MSASTAPKNREATDKIHDSLPEPDWMSPCGLAWLYNRDCWPLLSAMPEKSVALAITDPPYGDQTKTGARGWTGHRDHSGLPRPIITFESMTSDEVGRLALRLCALSRSWVILTVDWQHMGTIKKTGVLVRFGVWVKPNGAPQFTGDRPGQGWEAVAICHEPGHGYHWNSGGRRGVWTVNVEPFGYHPCQKPVQLYLQFIRDFLFEVGAILDPFMGSGTSGVAALQRNVPYVGIELNKSYFDIACERIGAESRQLKLF